jgi:replicative DNA helicase
MDNPEYSLIALLLNYPDNFERFKNLPNMFQDRKCKYIYALMKKQLNYTQSTIYQIAKEHIKQVEFDELYEYYFEEDELDSYKDYLQSKYAVKQVKDYSSKLSRVDYIRYDEVKEGIEKIIIDIDNSNDEKIQNSQQIIKEMQAQPQTICKLVKSGIPYIDRHGGLESTDYVVIAARPSQGKTTYALNLIGEDFVNGIIPGFFTTETNNKKVMSILACMFAGVEEDKYRIDNLSIPERDRLATSFRMLYDKEIYLDGTPKLKLTALKRKAHEMVKKHGVQKIYIDYLQRVQYYGRGISGRYETVTYISSELKALAVELEVPVIALAQLNRNSEKEKREPRIDDLKNSGDIEQDADIIDLLYHESTLEDGTVNVKNIIGKYRNGPVGSYYTLFNKPMRRIRNYE